MANFLLIRPFSCVGIDFRADLVLSSPYLTDFAVKTFAGDPASSFVLLPSLIHSRNNFHHYHLRSQVILQEPTRHRPEQSFLKAV